MKTKCFASWTMPGHNCAKRHAVLNQNTLGEKYNFKNVCMCVLFHYLVSLSLTCLIVYMYIMIVMYSQEPEKSIRELGARITGGCELRDVGVRNQIQLLCKVGKCSYYSDLSAVPKYTQRERKKPHHVAFFCHKCHLKKKDTSHVLFSISFKQTINQYDKMDDHHHLIVTFLWTFEHPYQDTFKDNIVQNT